MINCIGQAPSSPDTSQADMSTDKGSPITVNRQSSLRSIFNGLTGNGPPPVPKMPTPVHSPMRHPRKSTKHRNGDEIRSNVFERSAERSSKSRALKKSQNLAQRRDYSAPTILSDFGSN